MMDELNFLANFDTGWYDPFHHELGVTLSDLVISQPLYIPTEEEQEEEEIITEDDGSAVEEEPADTAEDHEDTASEFDFAHSQTEPGTKSSGGCSCTTVNRSSLYAIFMAALLAGFRRKEN